MIRTILVAVAVTACTRSSMTSYPNELGEIVHEVGCNYDTYIRCETLVLKTCARVKAQPQVLKKGCAKEGEGWHPQDRGFRLNTPCNITFRCVPDAPATPPAPPAPAGVPAP